MDTLSVLTMKIHQANNLNRQLAVHEQERLVKLAHDQGIHAGALDTKTKRNLLRQISKDQAIEQMKDISHDDLRNRSQSAGLSISEYKHFHTSLFQAQANYNLKTRKSDEITQANHEYNKTVSKFRQREHRLGDANQNSSQGITDRASDIKYYANHLKKQQERKIKKSIKRRIKQNITESGTTVSHINQQNQRFVDRVNKFYKVKK